jgi:hypothetical protein
MSRLGLIILSCRISYRIAPVCTPPYSGSKVDDMLFLELIVYIPTADMPRANASPTTVDASCCSMICCSLNLLLIYPPRTCLAQTRPRQLLTHHVVRGRNGYGPRLRYQTTWYASVVVVSNFMCNAAGRFSSIRIFLLLGCRTIKYNFL